MRSGKTQGTRPVWALVIAVALAGCSGDDDEGAASGGDRDGDGITGAPTAVTADGTKYWGTFPVFPGAGTSEDASEPLPGGMVCDAVPGADVLIPDPIRQCFFDKNDPLHLHPAATLEQVLECVEEGDAVHLRLTFHPGFVDNSYGANAIGWTGDDGAPAPMMDAPMMDGPMMPGGKPKKPGGKMKGPGGKGHTFRDLVGSDHAEIIVTDGNGRVVLQFKLDYVSEDASAPSGYASLGVTDGEGKVIVGDASDVVQWMTSIDRNLNERGYGAYTTDSPATDADYMPNAATPEWDYRVVYEAWIDADLFGSAGFGGAIIEYVHASPAKAESNTIEVEPGDCPPPPCVDNDPDTDKCDPGDDDPPPPPPCEDNDPDTWCGEGGVGGGPSAGTGGGGSGQSGNGGGRDPCEDNDPDTICGDGGPGGPGGDPLYCVDNPDDPACEVD